MPFVLAAIVLLDQATKTIVRQSFTFGESVPLFGFIRLTYHRNTGAAFGLFEGRTAYLAAASLVFIAVTAVYLARRPQSPLSIALSLVLGGAIGNAIDRLSYGYVVDFIDLRVWPIFNVADAAISCGVAWILGLAVFGARARSAP